MRIAHLTPSLSRSAGGLFYSVSGLADSIARLGHEVAVFGGADAYFSQDRAQWGALDLRPHAVLLGQYCLNPRILAALLHYRPDILHVHGIWSATSAYAHAARLRNIPVVISPRGMLDPWILARKPGIKAIHAAVFERPLMAKAHVHALTESESAAAAAFLPSAAGRTFVVPNGIPDADVSQADSARSGALCISRLHGKKQTLELIDAWQSSTGLSRHHLTIAGWGDAQYEQAVREKAARVANMSFVGPLYGAEKTAALRAAKFFILPSLSEGLPMAVLEALQFGVVPIITDHCNLPELFANGVALRMQADFSDFEKVAVQAFAISDPARNHLSAKAKAFSARYNWRTISSTMVEHYEKIRAP